MKSFIRAAIGLCLCTLLVTPAQAQSSTTQDDWKDARKNVVRYNLTAPALFGFDKAVILGYERLINAHQSVSFNIGKTALPKLISISTDSFGLAKDSKNTGINFSLDYRFYLRKENRYIAPRGIYLGPYYAFTQVKRETDWSGTSGGTTKFATTKMDVNWNVIGAQLGYQFVFWDRVTLDLVLVGPGLAWYNLKARAEGNLTADEKEQLLNAVEDIIQQKFPGFNYVFGEEELSGSGSLNTTSVGFRYLIHLGFLF
jgi:hypothetical protein